MEGKTTVCILCMILLTAFGKNKAVFANTETGMDSAKGCGLSVRGRMVEEGKDCMYAVRDGFSLARALYGGMGGEENDHDIYCLKDGKWELFVSHPPESVNNREITHHSYHDRTYVSNLVYHDGFLYYSLLYEKNYGEGEPLYKPQYIYRAPEQGGEPEELALCHSTFHIYNGKIYYRTAGEPEGEECRWEELYWEMEPDGSGRRVVYCRKSDRVSYYASRLFTVGDECLYAGHEEDGGIKITKVSLKTGDLSFFTAGNNVESLYYENGYLYLYAGDTDGDHKKKVERISMVSGVGECVAGGLGTGDGVWMENGYLYYTKREVLAESKGEVYCLNMINVDTGQRLTEDMGGAAGNRYTTYLAEVGGEILCETRKYQQGEEIGEEIKRVKYTAGTLDMEKEVRKRCHEADLLGTVGGES